MAPAQPTPHPLCALLRQLRQEAKLSLTEVQQRYGISAIVLGSYERGDREPPLRKMEAALGMYGYRLLAVPIHGAPAVRLSTDMAAELRAIADQLENSSHAMQEVQDRVASAA
jgi:transcriptional regulator with XRE-family HTH domain